MTTRILPAAGGTRGVTVNGTRYTLTEATTREIVDADAAAIAAAGAGVALGTVGPTPSRPTNPVLGAVHFDTSSNQIGGKPVWWDGATWRDQTGARA
jgi:hypothetical protein